MEVAKILSLNRSNFHKRSFVRLFVPHHQHSLNFYFPKFSRREIWRSALSNTSGQTTFCSHSETSRPPFEYMILQRKWWVFVKNCFRLLPCSDWPDLEKEALKTISNVLNNIAWHLKIFDLKQWDCSSIQDLILLHKFTNCLIFCPKSSSHISDRSLAPCVWLLVLYLGPLFPPCLPKLLHRLVVKISILRRVILMDPFLFPVLFRAHLSNCSL